MCSNCLKKQTNCNCYKNRAKVSGFVQKYPYLKCTGSTAIFFKYICHFTDARLGIFSVLASSTRSSNILAGWHLFLFFQNIFIITDFQLQPIELFSRSVYDVFFHVKLMVNLHCNLAHAFQKIL